MTPGLLTMAEGEYTEEARTPLPLSASSQRGQEMEEANGEKHGLKGPWVHIPALPLTSSVTMSKSFHFSGPQSPRL